MSRNERFGSAVKLALGTLVLGLLVFRAAGETGYMARAFSAPGPNTVGEAGKVFFADRIREGRSPFADGKTAPYYPSVHGFLTHALVGGLAAAAAARNADLYGIGRLLSLLFTLLALILLGDLARREGVPYWLGIAALLVWIGSGSLVEHAVSYRPDHWLLFLGSLGLWVVAARRKGRLWVVLLALLPVLAFHVKSTGIALSGALVLSLLLQGRRRLAIGLAGIHAVGIVASIAALAWVSGGEYIAGLRATGQVPFDVTMAFTSLWGDDPVVPWLILMPIVGAPAMLAVKRNRHDDSLGPVFVFWGVTLAVYAAAAARSGSNTYYFLEPASYSLLIGMIWLRRGRSDSQAPVPRPVLDHHWALPAVTVLLAGVNVLTEPEHLIPDVALYRTERYADHRADLAQTINERGLYCYSNDPGLNVLLDRPAVIYPLLQRQMIDAGTISPETLDRPLETQEFDCVVLTGLRWRYRGEPALPNRFYELTRSWYPEVERLGPYRIHLPTRGDPETPPRP